jgi:glycosyltransferase involved in cell wall biosynthesis
LSILRIVSNIRNLDRVLGPLDKVSYGAVESSGRTLRFLRQCLGADLVILDDVPGKLLLACVLRPFSRFCLVSVDLILRPPKGLKGRLGAFAKRLLLSRVDRFVLYFRDVSGFERHFGIGPERVVYIPFKVNGWERLRSAVDDRDGEYVLCAGRTLRDLGTFVAAMEAACLPGVLLQQKSDIVVRHGTHSWIGDLPPNLHLVVDEDGSLESFIDYIARARIVVIPRFQGDICATGISTYLIAMALRRCVVISAGPGTDDVLTDQAAIVPPEDPERLACEVVSLFEDDERRRRIAAAGRRYAEDLQGEDRLLHDIARTALDCIGVRDPAA